MRSNTRKLKKFTEEVINIIFPLTCPVCQEVLKVNYIQICDTCKKSLPYIGEPMCKKCGKPLMLEEQEYCYDCSKKEHLFNKGIALWVYDDRIKGSLYRFKYNNKREYAKVYANEIMHKYGEKIMSWNVDAIIPVPLHKSKLRSRGYNQAEILAKELSTYIGAPVYTNCVKRIRKTLPQKGLNNKQRINNLKNAFKIVNFDVKLNKVLLIDDIYTTGVTMDGVAEVLRETGVSDTYFVTVSTGDGL
ncbi:ComF family protein [Lachnotalea glycerini]|uniref:ComF family protein n=1 Tax=Lachnotalea glycerini TaxID=1763509 RepID=A0A318ES78_9FIRM|nr:ComF family protein [Lachnotalea glycerini]PXV90172.1 ComF family protein [Lachnotalea glycerini]